MFNRYIEFDSGYRDRKQWPKPSQFIVQMSQSGQKGRLDAIDPVSNAAPILFWNNSFIDVAGVGAPDLTTGAVITVTAATIAPSVSGQTTFQITAATGVLRHDKNFYVGATLSAVVAAVTYSRRILSYNFLGASAVAPPAGGVEVAIVTLDSAIVDATVGTATFYITNPTPLSTNSVSPAVIKFFIPSGSFIDNFYNNYFIQSLGPTVDNQLSRQITAYDGTTRLATLASATTGNWRIAANSNNNYVIRKELPLVSNQSFPTLTTIATTAVSSNGLLLQLNIASSSISAPFIGSFLRMMTPYPTSAGFSTIVAPYGEQRLISNYFAEDGTFTATAGATFTFGVGASTVDDFYTGAFITTDIPETYQIASYVGATRSGTVSTPIITPPATWSMRTVALQTPFSVNPNVGPPVANVYEIEGYSKDNAVPFVYTGSLVSSQETVCYEVELLNLILPNLVLKSGRGGRTAFYPYMYVELQQVSAASSGGNKGIIYSNNPNAYRMLYRVPMDDTPAPLVSTFIKVDGDGMVHTIKFKPNDAFKFSVFHASGELFETEASDFYSPTEPNPLVQISACFSFKRV